MPMAMQGLHAALMVTAFAANPIVPGVGLADPHMHVWPSNPNKVYVYATHDCNRAGHGTCVRRGEVGFYMTDWWVWSSLDLVNWKLETKVQPDVLSWENENTTTECWATDAASFKNGSTYFYLSVGPKQIGVVSASSPVGPFKDPIGQPLIPIGLVPTYSRDPGILMLENGTNYLIFGTFNYFMARLNPDMISLSETPRAVKINGEQHRDDKPFLHQRGEIYYLSWGCFYAIGSSPYGPFNYMGSVINVTALQNTSFASGGGTQDRHGSFFEFKGQTYFACNDRSHGGGGGFRSSIIAYVHYRRNGTIPFVSIDETGVGQYNISVGVSGAGAVLEAEDYFEMTGEAEKQQITEGRDEFEIAGIGDGCKLSYPKLLLTAAAGMNVNLHLQVANGGTETGKVTVFAAGKVVGGCQIPHTGSWTAYKSLKCGLLPLQSSGTLRSTFSGDLILEFSGGTEFAHLDFLRFAPNASETA